MRHAKKLYIVLAIISLFVIISVGLFVLLRFWANKTDTDSVGKNERPPVEKPQDNQNRYEKDILEPPQDAPHDKPDEKPTEKMEPKPHPKPGQEPDEVFYYRGTRTIADDAPFTIVTSSAVRTDDKNTQLEIAFSKNINPKSVNRDSIFIDGKALPDSTRFSFNKKGDTIQVTIQPESNSFLLTVQGIASFDGTKMEPYELLIKPTE